MSFTKKNKQSKKEKKNRTKKNLENKCNEVNGLVEKNTKDVVLIKKIREAHDLFHVVQGLCHD